MQIDRIVADQSTESEKGDVVSALVNCGRVVK
jgi:hypothetical protein